MKNRARSFTGLAIVLAMTGVGAGAWYAVDRGWFPSDGKKGEHEAAKNQAGTSAADQNGMEMNMPGMKMEGMADEKKAETSEVLNHAVVQISPELQQRIGVTVGNVEEAPLKMAVRAVGIVRPDETKESRIHLKTEGWVEKLSIDYTGQEVRKGDALLAIYSPEFLTTQQEYLNIRATQSRDKTLAESQQRLADSSLRRLELWDVPQTAIEELKRTGQPHRTLTLQSPLAGTVLKKDVMQGEYVTPQKELYVIADLSTVWVQAKVYEYELPHVQLGQPATVTFPAVEEREFTGKVVFVQPVIDEATRTAQVRIELPNPDRLFKPGMFAHVTIAHTMGTGLLVPASAVLRTGERAIAYRAKADHQFVPIEIEISSMRYDERYHVLSGLKKGDRIVTSANFLVDSESRLRAGGGGMAGMDMGGSKKGATKGMQNMDKPKPGEKPVNDHSRMKP